MSGIFGFKRSAAFWTVWPFVSSQVFGQLGVKQDSIGGEDGFVRVTATLYGLTVTGATFEDKVFEIHRQLYAMPKGTRKKLRCRNLHKLDIPVRPKAAALKRVVAKKFRETAAERRAKSVKAYQDKHLVLVTKDGKPVFNNVKEHSAQADREAFYRSWEWRKLRMQVIKQFARRCMCCGATPEDVTVSGAPVRLVVDHIKPLSKYWHMRLVPSNLQILCDECNMGKGAWDETDHRSESQRLIAQQLQYEV